MSTPIRIEVGDLTLEGSLAETDSGRAIAAALPIEASIQTWGDEFYFTIPVELSIDDTAQQEVDPGTIGYWPTGRALCLFFGPTPMSSSDRPVAASPVNLVGTFESPTSLREVSGAEKIRVSHFGE